MKTATAALILLLAGSALGDEVPDGYVPNYTRGVSLSVMAGAEVDALFLSYSGLKVTASAGLQARLSIWGVLLGVGFSAYPPIVSPASQFTAAGRSDAYGAPQLSHCARLPRSAAVVGALSRGGIDVPTPAAAFEASAKLRTSAAV